MNTAASPQKDGTATPAKARRMTLEEAEKRLAAHVKKAQATKALVQQLRAAKRRKERTAERREQDGQKLLVGAVVLAAVDKGKVRRDWLAALLREGLTREHDKKRLAPILAALDAGVCGAPVGEGLPVK